VKILVFVHELVVGGTTVNAIELTAALRDRHGHDVVLFAIPGRMTTIAQEQGLRVLPAPVASRHPSAARMASLRDAVRSERPDLLHVWETWPCVDAYYSVYLPMRIPMVVTDMQMYVTRLLPKGVLTTFGTPDLVAKARATGHRRAELLLPPVDVDFNAPAAVDPAPFRDRYGIESSDITLVTVSRLVETLKGESLVRTIHVVRQLGKELPLRFVIVGDGTARADLERLAAETNRALRRAAVVLTGARLDPRSAYAAADIVVGMGGSALRGMAFGKPVVIVGERGFSATLTSQTAGFFYHNGIYGQGDGSPGHLLSDIRQLAEHPEGLAELGDFSRQFVVLHFSLNDVAAQLAELCRVAVTEQPRIYIDASDALRTAAIYLRERRFLWRAVPQEPTCPAT
jgi:L-malate glycosyltransferase